MKIGSRRTVGLAGCAALVWAACVNAPARIAPEQCPAGQTACAEVCVDTSLHPQHCGACDVACASGELCSLGQCGTECLGGTRRCGDVCVDSSVDPLNCGDCGVVCAGGQQCNMGACTSLCGGTDQYCGGSCVDTTTSVEHCGACDMPCAATQLCVAGACIDATSCIAIKNADPLSADGVYQIDPDGGGALTPISTYCDMTSDGGGWTLLARTIVGGLTMAEQTTIRGSYWAEYTDTGYGSPTNGSRLFWLALKYWRALTTIYPSNLFWQRTDNANMVRVRNLSIADSAGGYAWAWTTTETGFLPIVGALNGRSFTARDVDNDVWGVGNCSVDNVGLNGGFWYDACQQLSMLHSDGNVYRLDGNAATAVGFSELYLR